MIKEALEFLLSLHNVETFNFNGHDYTSRQLARVKEDEPTVFSTKTLASLVELILKEHTHGSLNDLIIHVESPTKVNVHTTLRGHLDRFSLYSAVAELPQTRLGSFLDLEEMNIMLKSTFVETEIRDKLIQLLGNIQEENVQTTTDDGFSQKVVAKTGIATVGNVVLPPIVKLTPFRTFIEVEQPGSEFLLRLRNGGQAALFEADGGAWKMAARKNIKLYFEEALKDLVESGKVIVTE